jgi:carboxylesterase
MFRNRELTEREQRMLGKGETEFFSAGRAPCVVAFHGFGGTAAELRPVLDVVARAGYAVDAALLKGHGTRASDLQEATFDAWVEAARERVAAETARHGRVVLLGFSLGSLVALQIASERPEGIAGLVAMGNALTVKPHTRWPFAVWEMSRRPMIDVYMLKPLAGDLVDQGLMDTLVTYDRHPLRSAREVWLAGPRVKAGVGRIACPTLVLHGRRDRVCSWRNAPWLAAHVGTRDVSVRIFERSGHVLCCDGERDEVAREVVGWLGQLP